MTELRGEPGDLPSHRIAHRDPRRVSGRRFGDHHSRRRPPALPGDPTCLCRAGWGGCTWCTALRCRRRHGRPALRRLAALHRSRDRRAPGAADRRRRQPGRPPGRGRQPGNRRAEPSGSAVARFLCGRRLWPHLDGGQGDIARGRRADRSAPGRQIGRDEHDRSLARGHRRTCRGEDAGRAGRSRSAVERRVARRHCQFRRHAARGLAGRRAQGRPTGLRGEPSARYLLLLGAAPGPAGLSPICRRPGLADGASRPEAREGNDRSPSRRAPGSG